MPCQGFSQRVSSWSPNRAWRTLLLSSVEMPLTPAAPTPPQSPSPILPGTPEPYCGVTLAEESLCPLSSLRPGIPESTGHSITPFPSCL